MTTNDFELGWFDRWFLRKSKQIWEYQNRQNHPVYTAATPHLGPVTRLGLDLGDGTCLRFWKANGGTVVELQYYVQAHHDWTKEIYIIHENKNLYEELSSIMTQHMLKVG